MPLDRIMVLGGPGSGKSTLGTALGERLGAPVIHLDSIYWLPGWISRAPDDFDARVAEAASGPRWVIDGNYNRSFEVRADRADLIVYLDVPVGIRLHRVLRRSWQNRGMVRADLAEECPDRMSFEFIKYAALWGRNKRPNVQRYLRDSRYAAKAMTLQAVPMDKAVRCILDRL